MKILNKNKKSGFKSTLIKIGLVVLIAFMIFGAFRSCVKVNASTTSLEIGYNYYWDTTNIAEWCFSIPVTNNSYVSCSATRFFQYFDMEYDSIRLYRFYPEVVHDEYRLVYYNSTNGNSVTIYNCVWDRTNANNPSLIYYVWYGNSTIYITNNDITYSGITQDKLFSVLTLGEYDLYQTAYNNGYTNGYNAGASQDSMSAYQKGRNEGYNEGLEAGRNEGVNSVLNDLNNLPQVQSAIGNAYLQGKDDGYAEGVESTNTYNFKTLFLSALEAPVIVISSALNFDFLGYNMKDFVFSLFTIGIIAFIIKKLI